MAESAGGERIPGDAAAGQVGLRAMPMGEKIGSGARINRL